MGYTAYFDRDTHSIHGKFTIQDHKGEKVFERIYSRSGQSGWTATSWQRGKSPTPFTDQVKGGKLWLYTDVIDYMVRPTRKRIGMRFCVSSESDKITIKKKDSAEVRKEVMLHGENEFPGSAGCTVIVDWKEFCKIAEFLISLNKKGIKKIPYYVL